jgi:hypothetical protein
MLDFRPRAQPTNYLSRREQRRLLAWVLGIGLVMIAVTSLFKMRQFAVDRPGNAERAVAVDTRFRPDSHRASEPDAVSIVKADEPIAKEDRMELLPGVNAESLAKVRDDTPWIRADEVDAWLNIWQTLSQSMQDEIARRATDPVGFLELFQQPRAFRGKVVSIRGTARQALYIDAAENAQDIDGYYRVIIRPDRGPSEPVFVYTLELPPDFPVGEHVRAEIETAGVFFKRMVYPADDGELRRTPVIMARTLTWKPPAAPSDSHAGWLVSAMLACIAVGVAGLAAVTYWATRVRVAQSERRPEILPPIDDSGVEGVEQSLSKLAEHDQ